jgi:hypothetical protein
MVEDGLWVVGEERLWSMMIDCGGWELGMVNLGFV